MSRILPMLLAFVSAPGPAHARQSVPLPMQSPGGTVGQSNATAGMTDILDIKPPLEPRWDPTLLYWILGIIGLLALLAAAWWWYRRRKNKEAAPPPPRPAHEVALEGLDRLQAEPGMPGKEYYFRLTAVLRGYLEGRYGFKALEMTVEELGPELDKRAKREPMMREVKNLLKEADPVKFAGQIVSAEKQQQDANFARRFIWATKPVDEIDELSEQRKAQDSQTDMKEKA